MKFVNPVTGLRQITGRFVRKGQGRRELKTAQDALYLTKDDRGPSLQDAAPDTFKELCHWGDVCRQRLREEMENRLSNDEREEEEEKRGSQTLLSKRFEAFDCVRTQALEMHRAGTALAVLCGKTIADKMRTEEDATQMTLDGKSEESVAYGRMSCFAADVASGSHTAVRGLVGLPA